MKRSFIFDALLSTGHSSPLHISAVHVGPSQIMPAQLRADLVDYFDTHDHLPPDKILLLGTKGAFKSLSELASSEQILNSLPEFTRHSDPPSVAPFCLDKKGPISVDNNELKNLLTSSVMAEIMRQGLYALFQQRDPVLKGAGTVHYVKPSGKHCEKFIRAANLLLRGSDVEFVAFCLLEHLIRIRPQHIYTDTAAISMLAYAAIVQMQQLDPEYPLPAVDSFSSHSGIRSYEFEKHEHSLFFISASTSGDLEDVLIHDKGVPRKNVVTLFYLGEKRTKSQILCDLSIRPDNPKGLIEIPKSYSADICPLCDRGLRLLRIVGDQFLTSQLTVVPELITLRNKPRWLDSFLGDMVGLRLLSCHRLADTAEERPRELFVDLAKLYRFKVRNDATLKHSKGAKCGYLVRLDRLLEQVIPASLSNIVYLRNPSSKALALRVAGVLKREMPSKKVPLLSSSAVFTAKRGTKDKLAGTVIVVAGAVVVGQQLMEVSQALRYHKGAVTYFSGLMRTRDTARLEEICSNLRQGGHIFNYAESIHLPDDPASRPSPWDREVHTLRELLKRKPMHPNFSRLAKGRISLLNTAKAREGLRGDLFWPSLNGEPLQLRPHFALWRFDYSNRQHTQADLYFTMSAVLHSWRTGHIEDAASEHKQLLLAPRNFVRFDDGIIQACLLRAASTGELDYRASHEQSELMATVLDVVFRNAENRRGEACIEFLLAILQGRLRLVKRDIYGRVETLEKLLSKQAPKNSYAAVGETLCAAILDALDNE